MLNIISADDLLNWDAASDPEAQLTSTASGHDVWRATSRQPLIINKDNVTLDGGEHGITIYGTGLLVKRCRNIKLKNLTVRLGARGFRRGDNDDHNHWDFEALKIFECEDIMVKNCDFSWGMDETVSIEDSKNVTIRKTIISYPLDTPRDDQGKLLHPKGEKKHALIASTRASKVVAYERCVFAHARGRNPHFSPNGHGKRYDVDGEVQRCVIYNFTNEGTKFNSSDSGRYDRDLALRIKDNFYVGADAADKNDSIVIESPDKKKMRVSFARNLFRSADEHTNQAQDQDYRSGWRDVDAKPAGNDDRIIWDDDGNGNPKAEDGERLRFEDVINEVGPDDQGHESPYLRGIKDGILDGEFPSLIDQEPDL